MGRKGKTGEKGGENRKRNGEKRKKSVYVVREVEREESEGQCLRSREDMYSKFRSVLSQRCLLPPPPALPNTITPDGEAWLYPWVVSLQTTPFFTLFSL